VINKIMALIQKQSMRAQCYEIIKEKILRQDYDLGEYINIVALSTELSVSNTPIREALTQLEADGLVTSTLNAKVQVFSFTKTSFKDLAQTIYILVKGAYELCVKENRIPKLLSMMEDSLMSQERCVTDGDTYQFIRELVNFDELIFEALESPQLLSVFKKVSNILFLMYRTDHQNRNWDRSHSIGEHRQIFNAIASGSHAEVDRLLWDHYNRSFEE